MGSPNAVIEIYKKNEIDKDVLAGTFDDDDDECCPFVPVLFQEAIHHFATVDGDPAHIFQYSVCELEKQKEAFLTCYKVVSLLVILHINAIIDFIKNLNNYSVVKVYV